jgi:hypothetical protein
MRQIIGNLQHPHGQTYSRQSRIHHTQKLQKFHQTQILRNPPPTPQAETPVSPLSAARLTVSQSPSPDPSTRQDAPVKTRIVVQTDRDFPVLRLAVECDGPLVDGNASTAGVEGMSSMKMTSQGVVSGHPNIFVLTYQSATPPFGPSNPVILNLWSKNPVTCNRASTF